jgi:hypothetical protein
MSNCKILTREMLHLPIDVLVEDSDLDFCRAREVADARARQTSEEPMLLAWYDHRSGKFSPRVE